MATRFDQCNGYDRQRLLVAADCLIAALENLHYDGGLWHIRGDLTQLRDNVQRMRRMVARQPTGGPWPWVFAVSACLWPIREVFSLPRC